MSDDASLIAATLAGDSAAFGRLVATYQDRLYNSLLRVLGSSEDAADIVQDAFVQAFTKLNTFRGTSAFYTWLYRIAFNLAMSQARRGRKTASLDGMKSDVGEEPMDGQPTAEADVMQQERAELVHAALGRAEHGLSTDIGAARDRRLPVRRDCGDFGFAGGDGAEPIVSGADGDARFADAATAYRENRGYAMSEQEFQPELNDELLSAYLDDELSAEERAAVEARLANDADAQQLLHQLRAVSESVQRLPLEGVGRDLSGDILRRVAAAKSGGECGGGCCDARGECA